MRITVPYCGWHCIIRNKLMNLKLHFSVQILMNALTILARTPVTVPTLSVVITASASSDLKGRTVRMVSIGIKIMTAFVMLHFSSLTDILLIKRDWIFITIPHVSIARNPNSMKSLSLVVQDYIYIFLTRVRVDGEGGIHQPSYANDAPCFA